jgi:hypothetical protein
VYEEAVNPESAKDSGRYLMSGVGGEADMPRSLNRRG